MTESADGSTTMRRDIASAYVVTAARVLSWVLVSAVVFRKLGPEAFAMLALVRATVGLLSYVSLGIGPAMVRLLSVAEREPAPAAIATHAPGPAPTLVYGTMANLPPPPSDAVARVYATGERVAFILAAIGFALAAAYSLNYDRLHEVSRHLRDATRGLAILFGVGIVFRVISEAPAGLLQVRGRIALDNLLLAGAEIVWATGTLISFMTGSSELFLVGLWFLLANFVLLAARAGLGRLEVRALASKAGRFDATVARQLLAFGGLVVLAQLADFLYAPVAYILINRLIDPAAVAVYAPAVQIDSGLHLLVLGLASVLLPRAAIAHAAGDVRTVRAFYLRGTLISVAIVLPAAVMVWLAAPWIFRLWLGNEMPLTQSILPLVLLHNLMGSSGTVGRSILLAMGRVRAYAASVLMAGLFNVALSVLFVRYFGLGLHGIVLGTIVAVGVRSVLWQPWYLRRAIAQMSAGAAPDVDVNELVAPLGKPDAP